MKTAIIILSMLISAALFSQDASLLNYVPADIDGFVYVNIQDILTHPKIKELVDSPDKDKGQEELKDFKKDLETNGVDLYKAFTSGVVYFRLKGANGGAVKTSINENLMKSIIEKSDKTKGSLKQSQINGKTVYQVENQMGGATLIPGDFSKAAAKNQTYFAYASPDVLVISDSQDDVLKMATAQDMAKISGNAKLMGFSSKINKASTAWGVFRYEAPEKKSAEDNKGIDFSQMIPYDNIAGGSFAIMFSGEKKDTVGANVRLTCKEKAKAQVLTVQLQAIVVTAIPNIARGNMQLADDLTSAFKFANDENDVSISFELSPSLQEQLRKATEGMISFQASPEIAEIDANAANPAISVPEKPADKAAKKLPAGQK